MKSGLVSSVMGICLLAGAPVYAQTAPKPPVVQKPPVGSAPVKAAPVKARPRPPGDGAPLIRPRAVLPPADIPPPPPIPVPPVARPPSGVVNLAHNGQSGIVTMQYELGQAYRDGRDVPQDNAAAVAWLSKAVGRGHAGAQFELGLMYMAGDGVARDEAAGAALVQQAADQGYGVAQSYVGQRYAEGRGVPQNLAKAYMWLDLAMRASDGQVWSNSPGRSRDKLAAKMTATQIAEGKALAAAWRPVAPTPSQMVIKAEKAVWNGRGDEAVEILLPLAADNNPDALFMLGKMYLVGVGTARSNQGALEWLRRAADQGHPGAQYLVGAMLRRGQGAPVDMVKAADLLGKAAAKGMLVAEDEMGRLYANGEGVRPDAAVAAGWFRKAADQGQGHAQYMLALDYSTGDGVPADKAQAYRWVSLAAIYIPDDQQSAKGLVDGKLKDDALAVKANLAGQLTPEQVAAIDAEVKAWRPVFQVF